MSGDTWFDLRKEEEEVLKTLSTVVDGDVSFTGMRRVLGMHQEKLSRILKRLERHGLINKTEHGYKLSGKARHIISKNRTEPAHVLVDVQVEDVGLVLAGVVALRGRWVDNMRWMGYSVEDDSHTLRWVSQEGSMNITLKLKNGRLRVSSNTNDRRAARAAIAILRKAYELALANTGETKVKALLANPLNIAG